MLHLSKDVRRIFLFFVGVTFRGECGFYPREVFMNAEDGGPYVS